MKSGGQDSADSGRTLAIGLAFALPLAAWLGLEYGREPGPPPQPVRQTTSAPGPAPAAPSEETARQTALPAGHPPGQLFRCEQGGKTVYTDQPGEHCADARIRPIEGPPPSAGLSPDRPFQSQLAEFESRRPPPPEQTNLAQPERPRGAAADRCAINTREQENLKSQLRQPHSAATGDALSQRLRQLTDEAFRLRC